MNTSTANATFSVDFLPDVSVIVIKLTGLLNTDDQEKLVQQLESIKTKYAQTGFNLLLDVEDLVGWKPGAELSGLSLLIQKSSSYGKIAIYGKADWQDEFSTMLQWFSSTPLKYFHKRDAALEWLSSSASRED